MNLVPCLLVFPRTRLKRQLLCVTFPCWSRHVSLMISRNLMFVFVFNLTHAVLETLLLCCHSVPL